MALSGTKADTEIHHVVPQANGGTNGKTVPLCNNHHDSVHAEATKVLTEHRKANRLHLDTANPAYANLVQPRNTHDYLVRVIVVSTLAVQNDVNKNSKLTMEFTGQESRLLDDAKKVFNCKSRQALVRLALQKLYQSAGINPL